MKRYKSTTILGGGPPGKIVQCQSFETTLKKYIKIVVGYIIVIFSFNQEIHYDIKIEKLKNKYKKSIDP